MDAMIPVFLPLVMVLLPTSVLVTKKTMFDSYYGLFNKYTPNGSATTEIDSPNGTAINKINEIPILYECDNSLISTS